MFLVINQWHQHFFLSLQRGYSCGKWAPPFSVGTSTTTKRAGWPSCSQENTTSTPQWPSPRATRGSRWPAESCWGKVKMQIKQWLCRPTAAYTAPLQGSPTCAQPHRGKWSNWRKDTSLASGCQTFRWWTTMTKPQLLGCTNCRNSVQPSAWN